MWQLELRPAGAVLGGVRRYRPTDVAPTLAATGIGPCYHSQFAILDTDRGVMHPVDRAGVPPYRLPTMAGVATTPRNGSTVVSTFSGCGGSSLGYRLAGFDVRAAVEFVPAARATYSANWPATAVLPDDVRTLDGKALLEAAGLDVGELDLLAGAPPCASFSTAGKRHEKWGKVSSYSETAQRSDDLLLEYARLVGECQPRAFVAENVSGLVKGSAKGYFKEILAAFRSHGYRVGARLLDAQWLGVPQARERLFFVGVRRDLDTPPAFPVPLPYRYTIRDALGVGGSETAVAVGANAGFGTEQWQSLAHPAKTLGASPQTGNGRV